MEVPPTADGSPYQEYVLTKKGQALFPVLVALGRWGSDFLYKRGEQRSVSVDVKNGRPLRRVEVRSEDAVCSVLATRCGRGIDASAYLRLLKIATIYRAKIQRRYVSAPLSLAGFTLLATFIADRSFPRTSLLRVTASTVFRGFSP